MSASVTFCLSPGTNISYTQERGGGQTFLTHGGDKHFHIEGGGTNIFTSRGDKHFLLEAVVAMMMLMKRWI